MNTIQEEAKKAREEIERLLRRQEAARYITDTYGLPCSPRTLAKTACVSSRGAPFSESGAVADVPGVGS